MLSLFHLRLGLALDLFDGRGHGHTFFPARVGGDGGIEGHALLRRERGQSKRLLLGWRQSPAERTRFVGGAGERSEQTQNGERGAERDLHASVMAGARAPCKKKRPRPFGCGRQK